jgi:hypothetical protein
MTYEITPLEQVERFNKLADIIEEHPDQFDMSWWVQIPGTEYTGQVFAIDVLTGLDIYDVDMLAPGCTTRGCVAGWAGSLWGGELTQEQWDSMTFEQAGTLLLGLDEDTQSWLFDAEAQHQSAFAAAEVLRDLATYTAEQGTSDGFVESRQNDA